MKEASHSTSARFWRRAATSALCAALSLGSGGAAHAVGLCIRFDFQTFVARNLRIPRPGQCKPFLGYVSRVGLSDGLTGSVCTNSDGNRADFTLTEQTLSASQLVLTPVQNFIRIDLPALTGTAHRAVSGQESTNLFVRVEPCSAGELRMD